MCLHLPDQTVVDPSRLVAHLLTLGGTEKVGRKQAGKSEYCMKNSTILGFESENAWSGILDSSVVVKFGPVCEKRQVTLVRTSVVGGMPVSLYCPGPEGERRARLLFVTAQEIIKHGGDVDECIAAWRDGTADRLDSATRMEEAAAALDPSLHLLTSAMVGNSEVVYDAAGVDVRARANPAGPDSEAGEAGVEAHAEEDEEEAVQGEEEAEQEGEDQQHVPDASSAEEEVRKELVLAINLPRRSDRREALARLDWGLALEWVGAVDGKTLEWETLVDNGLVTREGMSKALSCEYHEVPTICRARSHMIRASGSSIPLTLQAR
jgi:hypothetical protein